MKWLVAIICFLLAGAVLLLISPMAFGIVVIGLLIWGGSVLVSKAR